MVLLMYLGERMITLDEGEEVTTSKRDLKEPRIYIGHDVYTKKWEVWLMGFKEPQMGSMFKDLDSYADVEKILAMAKEKYPKWLH
jgi:hypothetical protein